MFIILTIGLTLIDISTRINRRALGLRTWKHLSISSPNLYTFPPALTRSTHFKSNTHTWNILTAYTVQPKVASMTCQNITSRNIQAHLSLSYMMRTHIFTKLYLVYMRWIEVHQIHTPNALHTAHSLHLRVPGSRYSLWKCIYGIGPYRPWCVFKWWGSVVDFWYSSNHNESHFRRWWESTKVGICILILNKSLCASIRIIR